MNQALQAVQISLTGMAATFAVLFILHILINIMARISSGNNGDQQYQSAEVRSDINASEPEEIAAIIAALSASGAGPSNGGQIRIEKVSG